MSALLAAFLCLYVLFRSPRNVFTGLLAAITACVAAWNLLEFLYDLAVPPGTPHPLLNAAFLGIVPLPALGFHFALLAVESPARRLRLAGAGYVVAGAFLLVLLASFASPAADRYFWSDGPFGFNALFVAAMVPFLAATIALLFERWRNGPPETRGVHGAMAAGGALLGGLGVLDLLAGSHLPLPRLSNLSSAAFATLLIVAVLRNRIVFDAVARLRAETSGVFAATQHGVVAFAGDGTAVYANGTAVDLLGGRPGRLADVDPTLPELVDRGGRTFLVRGDRILDAHLVRARGSVAPKGVHYLVVEDRTAEYRLAGELAQREALASIGQAAATLVHEIRNPLTTIRTAVDTLLREEATDPAKLELVEGQVKRLNDLVERSLDLARALELRPETVDLNRLVRRVVEVYPVRPPVRFELADGLPPVRLDPDLFGRLLANLLKNAEEAGATEIAVRTATQNGRVRLTVRNPGPPIPDAAFAKLFTPFVTTKPGGNGLGLAWVRKIARAHGGEVRAANLAGAVEFTVEVPWTS